jgi:transcriptional regulator with XRE-family HTH domain
MSTEATLTTFGARLAAKRRAAGMTQDQLGEGLGPDGSNVSKGAVSAWEVDRTQPSAVQITRLCEKLKCSADELLGIKLGDTGQRRRLTDPQPTTKEGLAARVRRKTGRAPAKVYSLPPRKT